MKPRLVDVSTLQQIIYTSAENNVAVFFAGSEEVLLIGKEYDLAEAVDEMIYALGYVPSKIRTEPVIDQVKLTVKLDSAKASLAQKR